MAGVGSEAQRGTGQAGPACPLKNGEREAGARVREEPGHWGRVEG